MEQSIKYLLKKIPAVNYFYNIRHINDFNKDRRFFVKNYMYSKPVAKEKLDYDMLFQIHKLEKGFSVTKNLRPFGLREIEKIIDDINKYEDNSYEKSFAYNLAYSALEVYKKFYEEKGWTNKTQYKLVKDFMQGKEDRYVYLPVGAFDYKKEDFIKEAEAVDYSKFISTRRSIRNFSSKALSDNDINKAVDAAIKTPTACNRQMCKIYYMKSDKCRKVVEKYGQGLGLFDLSNANYFVITFDVNANYFMGERYQGWFNAGLLTMNFLNSLHSLGIGSCCVQFGNTFKEEKKFKKELDIPSSERVAVIVVAGYYDKVSKIPYSTRKPMSEIFRER